MKIALLVAGEIRIDKIYFNEIIKNDMLIKVLLNYVVRNIV